MNDNLTLSGSAINPDILRILRDYSNCEPGYMLLHTSFSINDEISHYRQLLDIVNIAEDKELYYMLQRLESIAIKTRDLLADGKETIHGSAKRDKPSTPPRPCPGTNSSCLYRIGNFICFTRNRDQFLKIWVNGYTVPVEKAGYDELLMILSVTVSGGLIYNNGDLIRLELPVTYLDDSQKIQSLVIEKEYYGTLPE